MDLSLERYAEVTRPGEWPLGLGLWGAMALGAWVLDGLLLIRENIREKPD